MTLSFEDFFQGFIDPKLIYWADEKSRSKDIDVMEWLRIYLPIFNEPMTYALMEEELVDFDKWELLLKGDYSQKVLESIESGAVLDFIRRVLDARKRVSFEKGERLVIHDYSRFQFLKEGTLWDKSLFNPCIFVNRPTIYLGIYKGRRIENNYVCDIVEVGNKSLCFSALDVVIRVDERRKPKAARAIQRAWRAYQDRKRKQAALIIERYYLEHALKPVTGALYKLGLARFQQHVWDETH